MSEMPYGIDEDKENSTTFSLFLVFVSTCVCMGHIYVQVHLRIPCNKKVNKWENETKFKHEFIIITSRLKQ
jgi:hypothetical protein